jgi:type I restriction enzyme S subunit
VYPDKLIRFRVSDAVLPQFVRYAMNSDIGRRQIESMCATTAGNIGVSAKQLKTVRLPVPSVDEQSRIVAHLGSLQASVDVLGKLQSETAAELGALMPSILSKAFRGEL